ncbi:MAG: hypothetical protein RLZZ157_1929 [Pseudomonadota bacterium]
MKRSGTSLDALELAKDNRSAFCVQGRAFTKTRPRQKNFGRARTGAVGAVLDTSPASRGEDKAQLQLIYPTPQHHGASLLPMNPLASFAMLIATAQSLAAAVSTRDNLHLRPPVARRAVAARLVSGMRLLRAFLRRLVILIALDLEWGLIDTRGAMTRPHGRVAKSASAKLSLQCLDADKVSLWLKGNGPNFKSAIKQMPVTPISVDMAKLYAELDFLAGIAANPIAKAKRLAFHLARTRQGIIMAPAGPWRIAGRWGTQVSAAFDAMAGSIMTVSRSRPPPLPPPRTHWPNITAL